MVNTKQFNLKKTVLACSFALVYTASLSTVTSSFVYSRPVYSMTVFDPSAFAQRLREIVEAIKRHYLQYTSYIEIVKMYLQMLKDYALQLKNYLLDVKNSVTQAIKPYLNVIDNIRATIKKSIETVDGIKSLAREYKDTLSFVADHYGSLEYWKKCIIDHCNPVQQFEKAFDATTNEITRVQALANSYGDVFDAFDKATSSLANGTSIDDGTNELLSKLNQHLFTMNATATTTGRLIAQQTQMQAQVELAEQNRKRFIMEKNQQFFKGAKIKEVSRDISVK